MTLPFDEMKEGLLPEEKEYSIVEIDTSVPPSDTEAANKIYEVDSLEEVTVPEQFDMMYVAYDSDENSFDL